MAASVRYDVSRRAQVRDTTEGIIINRQAIAQGLTISAGDSDPGVILKAFAISGFPLKGAAYPFSGYEAAVLVERNVRSIDRNKNCVDIDLVYRSPPVLDGGGGIFFTLTTQPQTGITEWYVTSDDGSGPNNLKMWYKQGATPSAPTDTAPSGATKISLKTHKILVSEVLRASGVATKAQWDAVKASIRGIGGYINNGDWGSAPRGTYLFLPPYSRNLDSAGSNLAIELTFLQNPKGWYAVEAYHNPLDGKIPDDVSKEDDIRGSAPPSVGFCRTLNGISLASIYQEADFGTAFSFTPDD